MEDLTLLSNHLLQALQGAAIELRLVFEGLYPVLEEPPGETHAALLDLEGVVHGGLVRFAGRLLELAGGVPRPVSFSLVHSRPPFPTHMITAPGTRGADGGPIPLREPCCRRRLRGPLCSSRQLWVQGSTRRRPRSAHRQLRRCSGPRRPSKG